MGYLDNSTIVIDAILTVKGREKLAAGSGFEITQFALADDEVDYGLWAPAHPLGSNYYGAIIENMPLLEASPDETQVMKFKLVSLPIGTKYIPVISNLPDSITIVAGQSNAFPLAPQTNGFNGPGSGYTAVLYDSDAAVLVGTGLPENLQAATTPQFFGDAGNNNSVYARGLTFTLTPKDVPAQTTTTLAIIGNETGAVITIPVTVRPRPTT